MPLPQSLNLEEIAYGLVLLQEICQGYDTPRYRTRALLHLLAGRDITIGKTYAQRWYRNIITTQQCIAGIETLLHQYVASK